jgi:hypothetical protein
MGRTWTMTLIAALSLLVGVFGLIGSVAMISDGLGITFQGTGFAPVGAGVPIPPGTEAGRLVALFGVIRGILSIVLVVGGVGTFYMRPSGRDFSLGYAVGWIVAGGVEPLVLHYHFGWQVLASAGYAFGMLALFNLPSWKSAFAPYRSSTGGRIEGR